MDSSGKAVTGSVNVSLTPVNVTDVNGVKGFPGSFTGVKPDGSADLLVSFGTVEFALEQNGQRLNLALGKSASIEIPSYANISEDGSSLKVGDSVPLWSLNEQTGNWVQEGTGIMVASSGSPTGLALRAEVTHFSWWNIDHVPGPTNPTLDCIAASDIGVGPQDNFAAAQICNMIAEIDRGLQNSSQPVNARQNTSILPGFDASKTIPIPNTTSWRVPANLKLKLKAYALNGTWYGEQSYQGITNANDKVSIQMRPIGSNTGANSEAIGLGWNKNYVIHSSSQTDTFTFSIPAGESRKITIASQNISTLEGTVRVLNGTQVISSSSFNPSYNTVIQVNAPSNSDFTLEVKGIKNAPGGYNLKLEKTVLSGSEVISSLPFYKLVNASGLSSGVAYQYKFSAVAGDLVRAHFQVPYPNSGSIALLHNQQSIKPTQLTGQGGDVRFNAVLPETGEYMLEISDAPKYALTLQKPTHVNLESNTTINVTSAFAYPSFIFDGIKDTIISLGAAYSTPAAFAPKISSFSNPDGTTQPFDNSINAWVKTLPATGTYTVDLEPLASDPNLNTSLTFGVSSVNIPTSITANSSVAGTISTVGSRAFYSLDLQVGDVVRMVVKAPNIFSPAVWVRAPNANTSFYDFSSGVVGELSYVVPTAGKQFGGSLYVVTQSGTYTLEVMTSNINGTLAQQTGDYSFNVIKPTPINLALDTPTMGSTTPFQFNLYTLNIPQTGYVNLGALENISNFPSWIKAIVFDSTGKPLIGNLDQYGFIKQLPTGVYTVALDPYQNQSTYLNFNDATTRAFTFAASTLEPPVAMDFISNALKNGLIDQFNKRDYFSFNATQNQHVTVTVTSLDGLEVTVTASPPFNGDFTVPAGGGCQVIVSANSSNTCAFTPSSTGQYVVSIRNNQPQIQSTGHYSISISQP